MSTSDKLLRTVEAIAEKATKQTGVRVKLGTVKIVSAHTLSVLIDGDTTTTPTARFCDAALNDRVVILIDGTQYYTLGARK